MYGVSNLESEAEQQGWSQNRGHLTPGFTPAGMNIIYVYLLSPRSKSRKKEYDCLSLGHMLDLWCLKDKERKIPVKGLLLLLCKERNGSGFSIPPKTTYNQREDISPKGPVIGPILPNTFMDPHMSKNIFKCYK